MTTITFDTLQFVETIKSYGVSEDQAKGIAKAFRDASRDADLTTSRDLQILEMKVMTEFTLVKWMLGLSLAGTAGLLTLVFKVLLHGG